MTRKKPKEEWAAGLIIANKELETFLFRSLMI